MSFGSRLFYVAIRGCLIATFAFAAGALHAQDDSKGKPQASQAEKDQQQTNPPLPITITGTVRVEREKEAEPDWNGLKCSDAKNHEQADLCEQRRMAKTSERTVDLSIIQIVVAVIGFGLVGWNLYYARQSAVAAGQAAEAAQAAIHTNRAWVCMRGTATTQAINATINDVFTPRTVSVGLVFINTSNSPALDLQAAVDYKICPARGPTPSFVLPDQSAIHSAGVVGPGQDVTTQQFFLTGPEFEDFRLHKVELFLYALLTYRDVYRPLEIRHTEACVRIRFFGDKPSRDGPPSITIDSAPSGPQNRAD